MRPSVRLPELRETNKRNGDNEANPSNITQLKIKDKKGKKEPFVLSLSSILSFQLLVKLRQRDPGFKVSLG